MMSKTREDCSDALRAVLAQAGLPWEELLRHATDVVLFGSRACGMEQDDSDWDLLCIGDGPVRPRSGIDIVWVGPRTSRSSRWLGSELAAHVVAFGRPLHGECPWMNDVTLSPQAVVRKRRRIDARMGSLDRLWESTGPAFRRKQGVLLRREIQRAGLLARDSPVPPASGLDAAWLVDAQCPDAWSALTHWMGIDQSARAQHLCHAA